LVQISYFAAHLAQKPAFLGYLIFFLQPPFLGLRSPKLTGFVNLRNCHFGTSVNRAVLQPADYHLVPTRSAVAARVGLPPGNHPLLKSISNLVLAMFSTVLERLSLIGYPRRK